ncbi:hypothetical protein AVEN_248842-1 [Araneus ventricosus]|uniref:Uncharacterized protein n=1 Tax=Araneus ventricosus TaxID=182803 RepID=A0A4Y2HWX8_ARAVE|nr:hypothetical protein AVEN_248842-1 [Araneus ventricosus]
MLAESHDRRRGNQHLPAFRISGVLHPLAGAARLPFIGDEKPQGMDDGPSSFLRDLPQRPDVSWDTTRSKYALKRRKRSGRFFGRLTRFGQEEYHCFN